LPLDDHAQISGRRVLAVNHVLQLLMAYNKSVLLALQPPIATAQASALAFSAAWQSKAKHSQSRSTWRLLSNNYLLNWTKRN
jgi:hypothetical protein